MKEDRTTLERAVLATTWTVAVAAGLVVVAAGVLSYSALYDLFLMMGLFAPWLAFGFPLLFDLAEVTAAFAVWNAKLEGQDERFALALVWVFTLAAIAANCTHAWFAWRNGSVGYEQMWLAVALTSLFPLSVALVTQLLKRTIDRAVARSNRVSEVLAWQAVFGKMEAEVAGIREEFADALQNWRPPVNPATAAKEAKKAELLAIAAERPDVTQRELADRLGRNRKTVREYLDELEQEGRLARNGRGLEVVE